MVVGVSSKKNPEILLIVKKNCTPTTIFSFGKKIGSYNKKHFFGKYLLSRDLSFNNYINGTNVP